MKLYTEEQVIELINSLKSIKLMLTAHPDYQHDIEFEDRIIQIDEILEQLTPIQLPSDEEIDQATPISTKNDYEIGFMYEFEEGAKWMRDKIQGGNK